ncbi:hypothetical protein QE152_g22426 [Popillia japonica]|uniref:Uncharacterized protein n=1 Tax=Popillia japonica TaxID=7064 RepID=A0AAW1KK19_POPJA
MILPYGHLNDSVRHHHGYISQNIGYPKKHHPEDCYTAKIQDDTDETYRRTCTNEIKVLRATENTLNDERRSSDIKEECETEDVVKWVGTGRRFWN